MLQSGTFLVSGAGSGIGQAISRHITGFGHKVIGLGRDRGKLERTREALPEGRFEGVAVDLADGPAALAALKEIRNRLKGLNGLVNNAGVFDRLSFHESGDAVWERQFTHCLLSAVRVTRELQPLLEATPGASVLNVASTLGLRPVANTSAYSAMKAAMVNWTQTLALEWAPLKIRVNCLCPGLVDTPIHAFHGGDDSSEARRSAHAAQPLGRLGRPEDLAAAAWFLLDESSSWTTGSVLTVDGGIHL